MIRTEFVRAAEGNRAAFTALLAVLPPPLCGLWPVRGGGTGVFDALLQLAGSDKS